MTRMRNGTHATSSNGRAARSSVANWSALWQAMRPIQWTKNGIIFAALVFGFGAGTLPLPLWQAILRATPGFLLFCLGSSCVYLLNDIIDYTADKVHPDKRMRAIASGALPRRFAAYGAIALLVIVETGAWFYNQDFWSVLNVYLLMQVLYCIMLKRIAVLDVFVIASGFVLRAIAGATVLAVPISPWLLLCTFLLALFLALCKRRHEKAGIESTAGARQRISLQKYDLQLMDQLIAITASATIVSYAIYTLWPETIAKFGSARLGFTIPFVMFGLFRYLDLLYRQDKGQRPEILLLTDIPLLFTVLLYGTTILVMFVVTRSPAVLIP